MKRDVVRRSLLSWFTVLWLVPVACGGGERADPADPADPCGSAPCRNGGVCKAVGPDVHRCDCAIGWRGPSGDDEVADAGPCDADPCGSGACVEDAGDDYHCDCADGDHDDRETCSHCAAIPGCEAVVCTTADDPRCHRCASGMGVVDGACVEVDACAANPCGANAACIDVPAPAPADASGRSCACLPGFAGGQIRDRHFPQQPTHAPHEKDIFRNRSYTS